MPHWWLNLHAESCPYLGRNINFIPKFGYFLILPLGHLSKGQIAWLGIFANYGIYGLVESLVEPWWFDDGLKRYIFNWFRNEDLIWSRCCPDFPWWRSSTFCGGNWPYLGRILQFSDQIEIWLNRDLKKSDLLKGISSQQLVLHNWDFNGSVWYDFIG